MRNLRLTNKRESAYDRVGARFGAIKNSLKVDDRTSMSERQIKAMTRKARLLAWQLLLDYVRAKGDFEELILVCFRLNPYSNEMRTDFPATLEYIEIRGGQTFDAAGARYQTNFKQVLLWLIDRDSKNAREALSFLCKYAQMVKYEAVPIEGLRYRKSLIDSGSTASPICEFILHEIERENDGFGRIPLMTCKNCGELTVAERRGTKEFCSKRCFYAEKGGAATYVKKLREYHRRDKRPARNRSGLQTRRREPT